MLYESSFWLSLSLGTYLVSLRAWILTSPHPQLVSQCSRKEGNIFDLTHSGLLQSLPCTLGSSPQVPWNSGNRVTSGPSLQNALVFCPLWYTCQPYTTENRRDRRCACQKGSYNKLTQEPSQPEPSSSWSSRLPTVTHQMQNKEHLIKEFPLRVLGLGIREFQELKGMLCA